MSNAHDHQRLILYTAKQMASALVKAMREHGNISDDEMAEKVFDRAMIHFHDDSQAPIAWNDVQAITLHNEWYGLGLDVPLVATEGYNRHFHTSDLDGGWMPNAGPHDHRDNFHGGFAFAIMHPGTSLPQQPWALY